MGVVLTKYNLAYRHSPPPAAPHQMPLCSLGVETGYGCPCYGCPCYSWLYNPGQRFFPTHMLLGPKPTCSPTSWELHKADWPHSLESSAWLTLGAPRQPGQCPLLELELKSSRAD